jgi:hypothetical protein
MSFLFIHIIPLRLGEAAKPYLLKKKHGIRMSAGFATGRSNSPLKNSAWPPAALLAETPRQKNSTYPSNMPSFSFLDHAQGGSLSPTA